MFPIMEIKLRHYFKHSSQISIKILLLLKHPLRNCRIVTRFKQAFINYNNKCILFHQTFQNACTVDVPSAFAHVDRIEFFSV